MEEVNLEQPQNQQHAAEIIPETFSETISESVFDKFFLEVSSLTTFHFTLFQRSN